MDDAVRSIAPVKMRLLMCRTIVICRTWLIRALHSAGLWPYSRAIVLCRPDAWGRVSFAATPVSIVRRIYYPDHSLAAGMYVRWKWAC